MNQIWHRRQLLHGSVASIWRLDEDQVQLEVSVPPGTRAMIHGGDWRVEQVGAGTHQFSWAYRTVAVPAASDVQQHMKRHDVS